MLDVKEEQKFKQLKKLGHELHIPTFEAFIEFEVFDKHGKLIQRHKQRSHSWVRNAYNVLFSTLACKNGSDAAPFAGGRLNWKSTAGAIANPATPLYPANQSVDGVGTKGFRATAGSASWGIQVGSGVNVEDFEDYVLQTPIAEGAGAGQLNYAAVEAFVITYVVLTLTNTIVRYLNNNSGGAIDVNEVGIIFGQFIGTINHALFSRDHLGVTVTVPDTGQLKVTYTIELTYPA